MNRFAGAVVAIGSLLASGAPAALTLGQTDTFEDNTTQGWMAGAVHPAPPTTKATGGPAGADDNFLQLVSLGGGGAGSRLAAFNQSQWAGDYTAAGITFISMDLRNLGPTDLFLRLLFSDATVGPPTNAAFSTDAIQLVAGGNWTSVLFPILASDLTSAVGTAANALSGATELRLFHSTSAMFPGESILTVLGVDNICAVGANRSTDDCAGGGGSSVPEPGTLALLGLGIAALGVTRRRRHP